MDFGCQPIKEKRVDVENLRTTPQQRNFIKDLFSKHGSLTNEILVKAAEPQNSPIHDLFIWSNRRAGHLYRLRQAARILRSYTAWLPTVVRGAKEQTLKANPRKPLAVKVRINQEEKMKRWVPIANALEDQFMRHELLFDRVDRVKMALQQLLVVPDLEELHAQLTSIIEAYMSSLMKKGSRHVRT